jgi:LacI family transcriptional regulator
LLVFSDAEDKLASFEKLIAAGAVDGFLLSDLRTGDPRPRMLAERGVAFATMGRLPAHVPQHSIDVDNVAAIGEVVDHLVAAGHRRLGFTGPADHEYWSEERQQGFRAAVARHGLRVNEAFVFTGTRPEVREFARTMLKRKRRPTAVVTSNDAFGADVINTAHSLDIAVGDELAVTGFGGGPMTQMTHPTLTTVEIPVQEAATRLVDLCLQAADGTAPDDPVILPTRLSLGGSA